MTRERQALRLFGLHSDLIRAAVALQVAIFEHAEEQSGEHEAIKAIHTCGLQIAKLIRQLKKDDE